MSLFRTVGASEERTWEQLQQFTSFADAPYGGTMTVAAESAGMSVTEASSMTLPAVYRCVSLNAQTISMLPVGVIASYPDGSRYGRPKPPWLAQPNDEYDWMSFICEVQTSLELDGNAFILKISDTRGILGEMWLLDPLSVTVRREMRVAGSPIVYDVKTDSGPKTVPYNAMVHIKGMTMPRGLRGLSPIACAKLTIGTSMAAGQFGGNFFSTGATLSGVIETPKGLDKEAAAGIVKSFAKKHGGVSKSHAIGILTGGATWKQMSVNPEESQFLATQRYSDAKIALCLYGIPPEYVSDVEGAKGYVTGLYARQAMWLQTGMGYRLARLEASLSPLLPDGQSLKFNRNAFLQMDPTDRSAFYKSGLEGAWMTPNEVRGREDMNPLPNGGETLKSIQFDWGTAAPIPAPVGG